MLEVKIEDGRSVNVRPFYWKDRKTLVAVWKKMSSEWTDADMSALQAGDWTGLANRFPDALSEILGMVSGLTSAEIDELTLSDLLKLFNTVLLVNRVDEVLPVIQGFFVRVRAMLQGTATEAVPGETRS